MPVCTPSGAASPMWTIHAKGSFPMNSAPQVQTAEISDADLDNVSGGLSPQAAVTVGSTTLGTAAVLSEVDSVKATALGVAGGALGALPQHVGVDVCL